MNDSNDTTENVVLPLSSQLDDYVTDSERAQAPVIVHISTTTTTTGDDEESAPTSTSVPRRRIGRRILWFSTALVGLAGVALSQQVLPLLSAPAVRSQQIQQEAKTTMTTRTTNYDSNGPPVPLPEGQTLLSRRKNSHNNDHGHNNNHKPVVVVVNHKKHSLPVVEYHDSKLPGLTALGVPAMHASEALACRESVINYVINATDAKDECDGLTKAFEKACSHNNNNHDESEKSPTPPKRSRTLREKVRHKYRVWGWLEMSRRRLVLRLSRLSEAGTGLTFFAEDAVAGDAFEDACFVVQNDLDDNTAYRNLGKQVTRQARRRLASETTATSNKTIVVPKPMLPVLPKLPKANTGGHVSMDTFDIMNTEPVLNDTTTELAPEAPKDKRQAKRRKKEVEQVAHYDPNSPEARMCCVSILNVYQENCSIDPEEDSSDTRLFSVVLVMGVCGVVKTLIRHFRILWLPEAAGCILVGGTLCPTSNLA